jgi:hypothetical protein
MRLFAALVCAGVAACSSGLVASTPSDGGAAEAGGDVVGSARCDALGKQANDAAHQAALASDRTCTRDEDCIVVDSVTCGSRACGGEITSQNGAAAVRAAVEHERETTCEGCPRPEGQPCSASRPFACVKGVCDPGFGSASWMYFAFYESPRYEKVSPNGAVSITNPDKMAKLSVADRDSVNDLMTTSSFVAEPSAGCDAEPRDGAAFTLHVDFGAGDVTIDAGECLDSTSPNVVKLLYDIAARYK